MKSNQSIAELAYHLWNARGRPHGSEEEDWLEAERQLSAAEDAGPESGGSDDAITRSPREILPASNAATSSIPDAPPSNPKDKRDGAAKI